MAKKLFFAIITIVLFFCVLEFSPLALSVFINLKHAPIGLGIGGQDVLEWRSGYIKDRELFWRFQPSRMDINSAGFRDREFSLKKDNNTYRIICMGDSITCGGPTVPEDTYPKALERLLNNKFKHKKFEVLNAGVPGYTSYQGLIWLKRNILNYDPDFIILYFGVNDGGGTKKSDKDQKPLPVWAIDAANYLKRFRSFMLIYKTLLYFRYHPHSKNIYLVSRVSPEDYKNNLRNIYEIAKKRGIKTLFIVRPVFYDPEKKMVFSDERYIPPENVFKFDIYSTFLKKENDAVEFFLDDVRPFNFHFTTKGQGILTEEIFKVLVNNATTLGLV